VRESIRDINGVLRFLRERKTKGAWCQNPVQKKTHPRRGCGGRGTSGCRTKKGPLWKDTSFLPGAPDYKRVRKGKKKTAGKDRVDTGEGKKLLNRAVNRNQVSTTTKIRKFKTQPLENRKVMR